MATLFDLGPRERQIVEAILKLGEVSVADVIGELADPPTYSTVRAILGQLTRKGVLTVRAEKNKYFYKATTCKETTQKSAVKNLLGTIFYGNAGDAIATMIDVAGKDLSDEQLKRIQLKIQNARKENR